MVQYLLHRNMIKNLKNQIPVVIFNRSDSRSVLGH